MGRSLAVVDRPADIIYLQEHTWRVSNAHLRPASLDKGKSVDVSFADIRLKKGAHTLTAKINGEFETIEPKKDGNELSVSLTCKEQGD